jgi:hypothetical protein
MARTDLDCQTRRRKTLGSLRFAHTCAHQIGELRIPGGQGSLGLLGEGQVFGRDYVPRERPGHVAPFHTLRVGGASLDDVRTVGHTHIMQECWEIGCLTASLRIDGVRGVEGEARRKSEMWGTAESEPG